MLHEIVLAVIPSSSGVILPPSASHRARPNTRIKPAIVENGSDFVTYRFPSNETTSVAFTPDGNAFARTRGGILKIAPNGAESYVANRRNRRAWHRH
jgi:hypothetical protein